MIPDKAVVKLTRNQIDDVFLVELRQHGLMVRGIIRTLEAVARPSKAQCNDLQYYRRLRSAFNALMDYYGGLIPENERWAELEATTPPKQQTQKRRKGKKK